MFRTRSSTKNPTLTQVDDVATTPSDACTPQPNSNSLTNWVMEKFAKAKKESRKQPAQTELPTPPLKCICGDTAGTRYTDWIKIGQHWMTEMPIPSPPMTRIFELPIEFEQVLRRRIDERILRYAIRPDYQGPGKPLFDECVFPSGEITTYFRSIDPTPGAEECCDKAGPSYKYYVLQFIVQDSIEEVLPGLVDGMGKSFEWWFPACCPAGYVAQIRLKVNHALNTTISYFIEDEDV